MTGVCLSTDWWVCLVPELFKRGVQGAEGEGLLYQRAGRYTRGRGEISIPEGEVDTLEGRVGICTRGHEGMGI